MQEGIDLFVAGHGEVRQVTETAKQCADGGVPGRIMPCGSAGIAGHRRKRRPGDLGVFPCGVRPGGVVGLGHGPQSSDPAIRGPAPGP